MKSHKFVLLHGTYADPTSNWIPWLKTQITQLGHQVIAPTFPTPHNQTIEKWIKILDKKVVAYNQNTILIGHSSAPLVICAKLKKLKTSIKAVYLIAPFLGAVGNDAYDKANYEFNHHHYDWTLIKKNTKHIIIFRSDNDPYVPNKLSKILSQKLGVDEIIISKAGHLNSESGFAQFPQLLDHISSLTNQP